MPNHEFSEKWSTKVTKNRKPNKGYFKARDKVRRLNGQKSVFVLAKHLYV